ASGNFFDPKRMITTNATTAQCHGLIAPIYNLHCSAPIDATGPEHTDTASEDRSHRNCSAVHPPVSAPTPVSSKSAYASSAAPARDRTAATNSGGSSTRTPAPSPTSNRAIHSGDAYRIDASHDPSAATCTSVSG